MLLLLLTIRKRVIHQFYVLQYQHIGDQDKNSIWLNELFDCLQEFELNTILHCDVLERSHINSSEFKQVFIDLLRRK